MYIYVLKLETGKYYVGKSKSPDSRINNHKKGLGSVWTKLYPVTDVIDLFEDAGFDELSTTLHYMKKYGIENVRGGDYVLPVLTPSQLQEINNHINAENGNCYCCREFGHFVDKCPRKSVTKSCFQKIMSWWFGCTKKAKIFEEFPEDEYHEEKEEEPGEESGEDLEKNNTDEKSTTISFGKHRGKTYEEVYKNNHDYTRWVIAQYSNSADFQNFQSWIKLRNNSRSQD